MYRYAAHGAILYGCEKSGKTSLLFQLAINMAREGKVVVFISPTKSIHYYPPSLSEGIPLDSDVLSKILIYYIQNDTELREFLSQLQHFPEELLPSTIIIDDFSYLFSQDQSSGIQPTFGKSGSHSSRRYQGFSPKNAKMAKTLGLLEDTTRFLNKQASFQKSSEDQSSKEFAMKEEKEEAVSEHSRIDDNAESDCYLQSECMAEKSFSTLKKRIPDVKFIISETLPYDATLRNYYIYSNWIPLVFIIKDHATDKCDQLSEQSLHVIGSGLDIPTLSNFSGQKNLSIQLINGQSDPLLSSVDFSFAAGSLKVLAFHTVG
eukprot:MONOS_5016.1-p1 / transcript=MONOS_5016.1 / gene=MONOS_5016 / organism=Monocercomonoides_exilis_PA203 / gene_product=unspecified product / transcript_product=unspecified product / location=Mono_scaffold00141:59765-60880(-) / protein_length=319 / sequence_SO=supercontig / SO=protein_coding / is_pseudo=false